MKVLIKELKIEKDGSEILYIRDIGFLLKSGTFSDAIKRCDSLKHKEEIPAPVIEAAIDNISYIVSKIFMPAESPSDKDKEKESEPKEESGVQD